MEALGNVALDKLRGYSNLDDNVRLLETKLQRLSCKKSDIELQVKNAERSGTKKRKREVENWLQEVQEIINEFSQLKKRVQEGALWRNVFSSGDSVAKMDARVEELMSQHFDGLWIDDCENRGKPRVTTQLFGEMFDQGLKRIWAWLVTDNISNIGIYGMGGVGKTTLAKHIHNHLIEKTIFKVYWVTVSQEFTIKKLQDDIANVVKLDLSNENDEDTRAAILSSALGKQQSVLIFDDVWEDFCSKKVGIPVGTKECKMILTTRSLELCNRMRCQRRFEAKCLHTDEAWDFFKYTLGFETTPPADVEEIAKSVAKRCAGLPLCIITVAGSMRGVSDIREWRNALEQLKACSKGHDEMERDVFPILEWSYSQLNKYQKHCFLYCSLFPEDYKIPREELINLFIGTELMESRDSRKLEFDQGHTILNKLTRVCLLEEATDGYGSECVKMHDLIRNMAIRITSGKSILRITDDVLRFLVKSKGAKPKEWTGDLDAVSIWHMEVEIPRGMSPKCPKLSTLLFPFGEINTIPDSFLRHMGGLKVLNLGSCENLIELPNCVSDMVNLTALLLGGCWKLSSVPPLGKLKQLRELDLSCTAIKNVPQGLEELENLERLYMHHINLEKKIIPRGTLSQLHELEQLVLPRDVQVCDPEVINQLEVFEGCLSFTSICKPFIISRWPKYYKLMFMESFDEDWFYDFEQRGCGNLKEKELVFHGYKIWRGFDVASLPKDIQRLEFYKCFNLSEVVQILNFSNDLSALAIQMSDGVEFLLKLSSPPPDELVKPQPLPLAIFSSIKILEISRCHKLKKLFTVRLLQSLENLEKLDVEDCEELEEIAAVDNEAGGGGIPSASSGLTNTITLPKLWQLNLSRLPQLNNICNATMICNSIQSIEVVDCPKVKRLPLFLPTFSGQPYPPNTLCSIRGSEEWWESLEWDNHNSKDALSPFFGINKHADQPVGKVTLSNAQEILRIRKLIVQRSKDLRP